ncbi:MAG TPA: hypothetical protein VJJ22_03290 [Candidatus Paceibacterota bacterium]
MTPELWKYLYGKLLEITTFYPKLYIKEANTDPLTKDHVHLLIGIKYIFVGLFRPSQLVVKARKCYLLSIMTKKTEDLPLMWQGKHKEARGTAGSTNV